MKYYEGENIMNILNKKIPDTEKKVVGLEPTNVWFGVQRHNHSAISIVYV